MATTAHLEDNEIVIDILPKLYHFFVKSISQVSEAAARGEQREESIVVFYNSGEFTMYDREKKKIVKSRVHTK